MMRIEDFKNIAEHTNLFDLRDWEAIQAINIKAHVERHQKNEHIINLADHDKRFYILLEGRLLAIQWTPAGREILFSPILPCQHFGEIAAIDGKPRSLSVVTTCKSSVLSVSQQDFWKLFDGIPNFRKNLMIGLAGDVRRLTTRNYEMIGLSVEEKLRNYLVRLAMKDGQIDAHTKTYWLPTHHEIASTIGTIREEVTRELSRLNQTGAIKSQRGNFVIRSYEKLVDGLEQDFKQI